MKGKKAEPTIASLQGQIAALSLLLNEQKAEKVVINTAKVELGTLKTKYGQTAVMYFQPAFDKGAKTMRPSTLFLGSNKEDITANYNALKAFVNSH